MSDDKDLISRVEEAFGEASLIGWQFAADGDWDGAERIFFEHSPDRAAVRIQRWLDQQATNNIAFEALFEFASSERFFFGARLTHLQPEAKSKAIQALLTGCPKGSPLRHVVQQVRDVLGERQLVRDTPDYLELGVFDVWNKVKPLVVWKKNEKLGEATAILLPDEIRNKTQKPDAGFSPLHEPQAQPLMLEACWKEGDESRCGFSCWVGLPVGDLEGTSKTHSLSNNRYLSAAATFIGSSPL